jgi:hypothetical protein
MAGEVYATQCAGSAFDVGKEAYTAMAEDTVTSAGILLPNLTRFSYPISR